MNKHVRKRFNEDDIRKRAGEYEPEIYIAYDEETGNNVRKVVTLVDKKYKKLTRIGKEIRRIFFEKNSYMKPSENRRRRKMRAKRRIKKKMYKQWKKDGILEKKLSQRRKGFKW